MTFAQITTELLNNLVHTAPEDEGMHRTHVLRALEKAEKYSDSRKSLVRIHAVMDGREWDTVTLDEIAGILREFGYEVAEPE